MFLKLYKLFTCLANSLQPVILLVFRLYWGWQFFLTVKGKLTNHEQVAGFFDSLGIPLPGLNAWVAASVECFGGLLILVGLASRPASFFLASTMVVAYLSVEDDRAKVFNIFNDPAPFLAADPFFFLLTALLILAFGPGLFSIDAILKRKFDRAEKE